MPTSITPCAAISAVAALIRASGRPFIWRPRILHESRRRGIISTLIAGASMDIAQWEFAHVPTTGVRRAHETPIVLATDASLEGFGRLVDDPKTFPIEIVRLTAQGWRPIDLNSGDQGGVTEGLFEFCWKGETLYARNNAVGDSFLFGWCNCAEEAATGACVRLRERALIWRATSHPDGGLLFYPLREPSFVIPLAPPGDNF